MDSNIISIESVVPKIPSCRHFRIDLDEERRVVQCRACGALIDPFDWIVLVSSRESIAKFQYQEYERLLEKKMEDARRAKERRQARIKGVITGKGTRWDSYERKNRLEHRDDRAALTRPAPEATT